MSDEKIREEPTDPATSVGVEIAIVRDFNGYFEKLARRILGRARAIGHVVRCKKVEVEASPYQADALVVLQVDDETIRLRFYSALRSGFGSLSANDLDAAARLL